MIWYGHIIFLGERHLSGWSSSHIKADHLVFDFARLKSCTAYSIYTRYSHGSFYKVQLGHPCPNCATIRFGLAKKKKKNK